MANDPWVVRGGSTDVPWLMLNEFDLLDGSANEDVFQIQLGTTAQIIERNGLVSGWTRRSVGKRNVNTFQVDTFSAIAPHFDDIGDHVVSTVPFQGGDAVGDRCFLHRGPGSGYQIPMQVNDWLRANYTGSADGPLGYGYMTTTGKQTETGAISGSTELTLPAISAGQKLIGAAHVSAGTFVDATLKVQRDDVWPMTTETDVLTFSQFTAVGSDYQESAVGAQSETKYRFDLSTTGGITTITFLVAIAIVTA